MSFGNIPPWQPWKEPPNSDWTHLGPNQNPWNVELPKVPEIKKPLSLTPKTLFDVMTRQQLEQPGLSGSRFPFDMGHTEVIKSTFYPNWPSKPSRFDTGEEPTVFIDSNNVLDKWKPGQIDRGGDGDVIFTNDHEFHIPFEWLIGLTAVAFAIGVIFALCKVCRTWKKTRSRDAGGAIIVRNAREGPVAQCGSGDSAGCSYGNQGQNGKREKEQETSFNFNGNKIIGGNVRIVPPTLATPDTDFPSAPPLTPPLEIASPGHHVVSIPTEQCDDPPPPYPGI